MEQEIRRAPAKDDVNIALLRDLQDEQDREIATILEGILDLVWGMFMFVFMEIIKSMESYSYL